MTAHGNWRELSPLLDRALDLSEAERQQWLRELEVERPLLVGELRRLLEDHRSLSEQRFLESGPGEVAREAPRAGLVVGAYRLVEALGEGGMGTVWLAERNDGRFDRQVAVKFPHFFVADERGRGRFEREGRLLARLEHPNIARLLDAGITVGERPFLMLEHVDGEPIDAFCDRRRLGVNERVRLFLDVLEALEHAHSHLVVHRDLKPSNVFVNREGQVKLLDFGIAGLLEEEHDGDAEGASGATAAASERALSPAWAAPEQLAGLPVTTAADVYAAGLLLYVLLGGRHPAGESLSSRAALREAVLERPAPGLSSVLDARPAEGASLDELASKRSTTALELRRALRGDLEAILARALEREPDDRYTSVTALLDDLRRSLSRQPVSARSESSWYRMTRFVLRNRLPVALASVLVVSLIVGAFGIVLQARTARDQRDFALAQLSRAEAVIDFNEFLLSDIAPGGRPFSVGRLLAEAEGILDRQQGNTASRVELLASVGRQYWTQDEDAAARRVLEKAYRLSEDLPDVSPRARATCTLASALARSSDLERAERLVDEGLALLADTPLLAHDRLFCLMRANEVALLSGSPLLALERVEAARAELARLPTATTLLETRVLMQIAESYRGLGRYADAIAVFAQAGALLAELGRDETQTAGTLYNNWALALEQSGRPLEAEPLFRRALEISRDGQADRAVSPMLLANYSRTLNALGRLDEAVDHAERALLSARDSGDQAVVNQAMLQLNRLYRGRGELDDAARALGEVEPLMRAQLPEGHVVFGVIASERSLLAQAHGDLGEALTLAEEAIHLVESAIRASGAGEDYLPTLLLRRAELELRLGDAERALADVDEALRQYASILEAGSASQSSGRARLLRGRVLLALGHRNEAHRDFSAAAEELAETAGPGHHEAVEARRLRDETASTSD